MASFIKAMDEGMKALLFNKFSSTLGLMNVNYDTIFQPKEVALRKRAERMGKDVAEFISYWRDGVRFDPTRRITPVAREGILLEYADSTKSEIIRAKAIPVSLEYNFWLWSTDFGKLQECIDLYLFWRHNDPNLNLVLNNKYPLELDLKFDDVYDESYTPIQYDKGTLYVHRFGIKLDGLVFDLSSNVKTIKKIILSVYETPANATYDPEHSVLLFTEEMEFTP